MNEPGDAALQEPGYAAEFLDGWSLAEQHVIVQVAGYGLRIVDVNGQLLRTWFVKGLSSDGMQEGGVVHVSHADAPHETLVVRDAALAEKIAAIGAQVQVLPGGERKLAYALRALAVLLTLFGLFYYFTPQLARLIAQRVSLERERALGMEVEAMLDYAACDDERANATLVALAQKLDAGRTYDVRMVQLGDPNAFALPGGVIMISSTLVIQAESGDEIAGVLAHEIEHVAKRHVLAGFIRDTVLSALWSLTIGDYAGLLVVDPTTAYRVANLEFSREDEAEADRGAVERLNRAGLSHDGLARFFERLQKKYGDGGPDWLSTHPSNDQRIQRLKSAKGPANPKPALTADELALLRAACVTAKK